MYMVCVSVIVVVDLTMTDTNVGYIHKERYQRQWELTHDGNYGLRFDGIYRGRLFDLYTNLQ